MDGVVVCEKVHKCSSWTQGPVFLQQLALLEGYDLTALGHNSAEYLHTLVECAKLAFADREAYYGDPLFDDVPLDVLLSKEYAARRRALVSDAASRELRPGDVGRGVPDYVTFDVRADNRRGLGWAHTGDTTHLDAVDRQATWSPRRPAAAGSSRLPSSRAWGSRSARAGRCFT